MKVALFTEAAAAGVGRHVVDLAATLLEEGHLVHLLYSACRMDTQFRESISQLRSSGAATACIDVQHAPGFSDWKALRALRSYLRMNGPFDLLHCHSTKAGFVGRCAALGLHIPAVYTPHAFVTMSPAAGNLERWGAECVERVLAFVGDAIICVSEEERRHAISIGLPSGRLFTVPNGIDVDAGLQFRSRRGEMRERFGVRDDDVCVGFVGRLHPQKSPHILINAFARLVDVRGVTAKLVLVGDGPLLPSLKEQVVNHRLEDRVVFAGEMPGLLAMSAFDLFALPSCYEALPYVVMEALTMGLPVVATAVGGISLLVRHEGNGFVVPIGETSELTNALQKLLGDTQLRFRMAAASNSLAERFSVKRMVSETVAVYESVRKQRRAVVAVAGTSC